MRLTHRFSRGALVVAGGLGGLALFALTLRTVDAHAIIAGVRHVGWGFALIFVLAGLRLAARAAAWSACAGGRSRLPFTAAFAASTVGEGAGNLTPLGLAASEPAKVLWVRSHLGSLESAASLAVETGLYSISVALMLVAGAVAWIAVAVRAGGLVVALSALSGGAALFAVLWMARRGGSRGGVVLAWLDARGRGRPRVRAASDGLRRAAEILRNLLSHRPAMLLSVSALEVAFQAAAVAEVWVTLQLLGVRATLLQAFLFEFANRVVTVVFKFVPMRLGVDEAASGAMASFLGSGGSMGVTLAVIRKARMLAWSGVGLAAAAWGTTASARARRHISRALAHPADGMTS